MNLIGTVWGKTYMEVQVILYGKAIEYFQGIMCVWETDVAFQVSVCGETVVEFQVIVCGETCDIFLDIVFGENIEEKLIIVCGEIL